MKKRNAIGLLLAGMLAGVVLTLTIGATVQNAPPPKTDWSQVQVVTYPNGETGFFDRTTGRLYMYDPGVANCYAIREFPLLGQSTRRIR